MGGPYTDSVSSRDVFGENHPYIIIIIIFFIRKTEQSYNN